MTTSELNIPTFPKNACMEITVVKFAKYISSKENFREILRDLIIFVTTLTKPKHHWKFSTFQVHYLEQRLKDLARQTRQPILAHPSVTTEYT
jgi:hypothetical protein